MKKIVFLSLFIPIFSFSQDFKTFKWGDLVSVIKKMNHQNLLVK